MTIYTQDEVLLAALQYFNNDNLAATTWMNKYARRDKEGNLLDLTPDDMHRRMAKAFAEIEEKYRHALNPDDNLKLSEYGYSREELTEEKIYNLFKDFKYVIPAGSVMSGIGNFAPVSLSNCWVINGPGDSLEEIFRVCNEQSQLMKRRGGVGFDISNLRPSGATVNNSAKSSTGAASFMDLFSHVTNTIAQNGRRGALMLSIHIQHPDSQLFIEKKQDLSKVTGANVSVQIDDEFMECVKADKDYFQVWPINAAVNDELTHSGNKLNSYDEYEYDKMYPMIYTDKSKMSSIVKQGYIKKIKAKELWNKLIHCAWNTAEPGIIFQTRHHDYSPDGVYPSFRGTCTNPCVTGDTKLHTNIGELEIKDVIDRINNGEEIKVLSYDNINDTVEYQQVNSGYLTRENANIIEIETEDGNKLRLTPDHKVYTENRGYIQASELTKDDILLSL